MKLRSRFLFCLMLPLVGVCFAEEPGATGKVHSEILRTEVGERVLIQEITLATSVEAAWKAYTTEEGWTGWGVAAREDRPTGRRDDPNPLRQGRQRRRRRNQHTSHRRLRPGTVAHPES